MSVLKAYLLSSSVIASALVPYGVNLREKRVFKRRSRIFNDAVATGGVNY